MLVFLKRLGYVVAAGVGVGVVAVCVVVATALIGMPDAKSIAEYTPPVSSRVYARDGQLIGVFARENRSYAPIESIPDHVIAAFMAAEDKDFYTHSGVDFSGVARAMLSNVDNVASGRRLEGASTITQQVAENILLEKPTTATSTFGKVILKVREIALAMRIEGQVSKDRILELYLNQIFLGLRSYGVSAAAQNYFGKPLDEISLAEAAYLGALPKAPNNYHPTRQTERALIRRNWVLDRMATNGFITPAQAAAAKAEPLAVQSRSSGTWTAPDASDFVEEVRRDLIRRYGEDAPYTKGFAVRSTLDLNLQAAARKALRRALEQYDRQQKWRGPLASIETGPGWQERLSAQRLTSPNREWQRAVVLDASGRLGTVKGETISLPASDVAWARNARALEPGQVVWIARGETRQEDGSYKEAGWRLIQEPEVQGAMVAIEAHTGRVLAMVGGYSASVAGFNRATQALRQPGSSIKPLVYAAALERGFRADSVFSDSPFVARNKWSPKNSDGRYYGAMPLSRALALSRNTVTVRVAQAAGIRNVVDYLRRFGTYDKIEPNLAISLGAADTTVYKMTTAYTVFTNGGRYVEPTLFDRLQDGRGVTVWKADDRVCQTCDRPFTADTLAPELPQRGTRVLDPVNAWTMVEMLEGAVVSGTGRPAQPPGHTVAGKTGTTNDNKDAWFVGFSPTIVAGVYIGYDTPRSMGRAAYGGVLAAPVFRDFMTEALRNEPQRPFAASPELYEQIDRDRRIRSLAVARLNQLRPPIEIEQVAVRTTPQATISFGGGPPLVVSNDGSTLTPATPKAPEKKQEAPEEVGGLY